MDRKQNRPNRPLIRKVCPLPSRNQPPSKQQCFFVVENRRVAPVSRSAFSPTGGPASGLFSNSAGGAPSPAPTPAPPTPACITADLFADCFTTGNVGWSVETPPGTVVFADQKVYLGSGPLFMSLPQGEIRKSVLTPAGAWTLRFQFTEINFTPTFNKIYIIGAFDSAGNAVALAQFTGDGTGFAGNLTNLYTFTWTPVQGATHSVILKDDGLGNLTLTVDGVNILLIPFAPGPVTGTPSVMDIIITDNDEADGKGSFDSIFFANGNIPDGAEFCCP
jgi:hypothetical protein